MRVLLYGESPTLETGAARVNRHLLDTIVELGIEVECLCTSHFFEDGYDRVRYPYPIHHIKGDTQKETHTNALTQVMARDGTFDVLFVSGDAHVPNIMCDAVRKYPSIVLSAIDGEVRHHSQVTSLEAARWPVVYSHYAYNQVLRHLPNIRDKFRCIPLGCEPDVFYPLPAEERREYRKKAFNITDDSRFLVMVNNRNQVRKDLARSMKAFHLFHERVPNSILYMNCRAVDHGGDIRNQAFLCGLQTTGPQTEIIFTGPDFTEVAGYPRDVLNKMYNAADVGISTAQGEGWGLTTTEFMAAGTPFIGPANTTFWEILGREPGPFEWELNARPYDAERGYIVPCGGDNLWTIYYGTDDAPRPITSVTDMANALYHVYTHREEAHTKAALAREWTLDHTWEQMKDEWRLLLCQVKALL